MRSDAATDEDREPNDGLVTLPSGPDLPVGPIERERQPRWKSIATVAVVLLIAGSIGWFLFQTQDSDRQPKGAPPARGVACPHLLAAADAYERGDRAAFRDEATRAAEAAQGSLQRSDQAFGPPERIALELGLGSGMSRTSVERLLGLMAHVCHAGPSI